MSFSASMRCLMSLSGCVLAHMSLTHLQKEHSGERVWEPSHVWDETLHCFDSVRVGEQEFRKHCKVMIVLEEVGNSEELGDIIVVHEGDRV